MELDVFVSHKSCSKLNSGCYEVGPISLALLLPEIYANWTLIGQLPLIGMTWNWFRIFLTLTPTVPNSCKKNFGNRLYTFRDNSDTQTHRQTNKHSDFIDIDCLHIVYILQVVDRRYEMDGAACEMDEKYDTWYSVLFIDSSITHLSSLDGRCWCFLYWQQWDLTAIELIIGRFPFWLS